MKLSLAADIALPDQEQSRDRDGQRPWPHVHGRSDGADDVANQVERWFALLEHKALKRGVHRSTLELEKAIYEFIEVSNEEPRPYLWTKSADDILDSLSRFCDRTLKSQGMLANF